MDNTVNADIMGQHELRKMNGNGERPVIWYALHNMAIRGNILHTNARTELHGFHMVILRKTRSTTYA